MNPKSFGEDSPGKLVPVRFSVQGDDPLEEPKRVRASAFVPNPLPPDVDWGAVKLAHYEDSERTVSELGKLNGLHKRIGNAAGLLRTLWMREAKLSSAIEGIETTAEELVLAGANRDPSVREQSLESFNYVRALEHGIQSDLPWSRRVICEMHERLLTGVRGEEKRPGRLRNKGVFIGERSRGPQHARFIPMPADGVPDAISTLEKFVNARHHEIPPLFVVALTHYQFETIHPFNDGNGRIGRVLISRSLVKEGLLEHPVVYMSSYINDHRDEYIDLLLKISQKGGQYWSRWIGFILAAIRTQAADAIWRSERLISLRETYRRRLAEAEPKAPVRLFDVVESLFSMPAINVADMVAQTGVTKPTAANDIRRLEQFGILSEYTGKTYDRDWVAPEIIAVIEQEQPIAK